MENFQGKREQDYPGEISRRRTERRIQNIVKRGGNGSGGKSITSGGVKDGVP